MNDFRLSTAPSYVKVACTFFLIVIGLGYLMGLLNVYDKTHISYDGVVKNYRGSEEEMIYGKEFGDMVSLSHNHLGGIAMMVFLVLLIFLFSSFGAKLKLALGWLPFVFILLDIGSMWLTRYVAEQFAWLFMFAGAGLAALFCVLIILNLYDLWLKKQAA